MSETSQYTMPRRLVSIDMLRGMAAIAVLLFHGLAIYALALKDVHVGLYVLAYPVTIGFVGVHLFLVLSGFCIHMRMARSDQQQFKLPWVSFWKRRFWRLYPAYLAAMIFSVGLMIVTQAWLNNQLNPTALLQGWSEAKWDMLAHLLMLHLLIPAFAMGLGNASLWSLALEEHLYLLYSPMLWIRNHLGWVNVLIVSGIVALAWRGVCVMLWDTNPTLPLGMEGAKAFLLLQAPSRWFEWCLGAVAVEACVGRITLPRWSRSMKVAGLFAGLAVACSYHPIGWIIREALWGMCFFTIVNGVVNREKQLKNQTKSTYSPNTFVRIFAGLGVISYSIYLIHGPILHVSKLLGYNMGLSPAGHLALRIGVILGCVPLAYIFYRIFEKPFIDQLTSSKEQSKSVTGFNMDTLPDITCPTPEHSPPITAIVVSRNEGHHLKECLTRLRFCDQIILVDMQSTDNTRQMGEQYADLILDHGFSPIVEPVRVFASKHATSDWVLLVDPDEYYPEALVPWIRQATVSRDVPGAGGMFDLPMSYYFRRKLLTSTVWGRRTQVRPALVNLKRCELRPLSMRGPKLHAGYKRLPITPTLHNHIQHYWMDTYTKLIKAMCRYVLHEGKGQYAQGKRFKLRSVLIEPLFQLKANLLYRNGLKDGLRGISLSLIYSAYLFGSAISLGLYQLKQPKNTQNNELKVSEPAGEQSNRKAA